MLADVLLRRAALVVRVAFDHRPDPLAGLKIDDEDLEKLLTELPGLAVADHSVIGALEREARVPQSSKRAPSYAVLLSKLLLTRFPATTRSAELSGLPGYRNSKPRSWPWRAPSNSTPVGSGSLVT